MFKKLYRYPSTIQQRQNAPLSAERSEYLKYLYKQKMCIAVLKRIDRILLISIDCLNLEKNKIITTSEIKKSAVLWAKKQKIKNLKSDNAIKITKRGFITHTTKFLEMLGRVKNDEEQKIYNSKIIYDYMEYQTKEKGLSERTVKSTFSVLKDFFKILHDKNHSLNKITIKNIDEILLYKKNICNCNRVSIRSYAYQVRPFLKYAEDRNLCKKGISSLISIPKNYQQGTLPIGPSWSDVKKLLSLTKIKDHKSNRTNNTNIRARAILMLLTVYGLRAGEICKLQLDDFDWKNETIKITRSKNFKPQILPLSKTVGDCILDYLKKVRFNNCPNREIFLTMQSPYKPICSVGVFGIVNSRLKTLNLKIKHQGPHSLRHSCATHLINMGISIKEISSILGHRDLDSTRIYAKVDLTSLRKVADFDFGGAL